MVEEKRSSTPLFSSELEQILLHEDDVPLDPNDPNTLAHYRNETKKSAEAIHSLAQEASTDELKAMKWIVKKNNHNNAKHFNGASIGEEEARGEKYQDRKKFKDTLNVLEGAEELDFESPNKTSKLVDKFKKRDPLVPDGTGFGKGLDE